MERQTDTTQSMDRQKDTKWSVDRQTHTNTNTHKTEYGQTNRHNTERQRDITKTDKQTGHRVENTHISKDIVAV